MKLYYFDLIRKKLLLLALATTGLCGCMRSAAPTNDSDLAVKARVERALLNQKNLDSRSVAVSAVDRVVTLSGVVRSHEDKLMLGETARKTAGVKEVVLNIIIRE